jgi:hypothetical protein
MTSDPSAIVRPPPLCISESCLRDIQSRGVRALCYKARMDAPALIAGFTLATFLLAGFVKGVVGLGLPTIGMGLLAVVMAPAQAAALLVVPSFVTNVRAPAWRWARRWRSTRCSG